MASFQTSEVLLPVLSLEATTGDSRLLSVSSALSVTSSGTGRLPAFRSFSFLWNETRNRQEQNNQTPTCTHIFPSKTKTYPCPYYSFVLFTYIVQSRHMLIVEIKYQPRRHIESMLQSIPVRITTVVPGHNVTTLRKRIKVLSEGGVGMTL